MKHALAASLFITSCLISSFALAQAPVASLTVTSTSIQNGAAIDPKFSYCTADGKDKTKPGGNISPQLEWSGAPDTTKSFAIVSFDPDVPTVFDDVNKVGKTLDENMPRMKFYHWVTTALPAKASKMLEGNGKSLSGSKLMVNDFAGFFKDKQPAAFRGYDGPCPPFNDPKLHHYHFQVRALDIPELKARDGSNAKDVMAEIEAHTVAMGEIVGTFSNYVK